MSEAEICCWCCIALSHLCENSDNSDHTQECTCCECTCCDCCLVNEEPVDDYFSLDDALSNINNASKNAKNTMN